MLAGLLLVGQRIIRKLVVRIIKEGKGQDLEKGKI